MLAPASVPTSSASSPAQLREDAMPPPRARRRLCRHPASDERVGELPSGFARPNPAGPCARRDAVRDVSPSVVFGDLSQIHPATTKRRGEGLRLTSGPPEDGGGSGSSNIRTSEIVGACGLGRSRTAAPLGGTHAHEREVSERARGTAGVVTSSQRGRAVRFACMRFSVAFRRAKIQTSSDKLYRRRAPQRAPPPGIHAKSLEER